MPGCSVSIQSWIITTPHHTTPATILDQDVRSYSPLYGNLDLRGYWQQGNTQSITNLHIQLCPLYIYYHHLTQTDTETFKGVAWIMMLSGNINTNCILSDTFNTIPLRTSRHYIIIIIIVITNITKILLHIQSSFIVLILSVLKFTKFKILALVSL